MHTVFYKKHLKTQKLDTLLTVKKADSGFRPKSVATEPIFKCEWWVLHIKFSRIQ